MTPTNWLSATAMFGHLTTSTFAAVHATPDFIPIKIVSSAQETCVLSTAGQVKCWGINNAGELGIGNTFAYGNESGSPEPNLIPANLGSNLLAKDLCVASQAACVVTTTGQVKCWGKNSAGQLGQERSNFAVGGSAGDMGDNLPYTNLGTNFKAKEIHCGEQSVCALSETGTIKCWGSGYSGELGTETPKYTVGTAKGEMGDQLPIVPLPAPISYLSLGTIHTCAASKSAVYCWGANYGGQSGIESPADAVFLHADPATAIKVKLEDPGVSTEIEGLTAGYIHSCAVYHITSAPGPQPQKLKCWGANQHGALGVGMDGGQIGRNSNTMGAKLPATQLAMGDIKQIDAHHDFSCALSKQGNVKCWGVNFAGILGLGDFIDRGDNPNNIGDKLPSLDLGLPALSLTTGTNTYSTCAILINHEIKCWGSGGSGTLGYGDLDSRGENLDDMGDNLPYVRYN